jgi:hypothetical protein
MQMLHHAKCDDAKVFSDMTSCSIKLQQRMENGGDGGKRRAVRLCACVLCHVRPVGVARVLIFSPKWQQKNVSRYAANAVLLGALQYPLRCTKKLHA